jgi:hypothetical protein
MRHVTSRQETNRVIYFNYVFNNVIVVSEWDMHCIYIYQEKQNTTQQSSVIPWCPVWLIISVEYGLSLKYALLWWDDDDKDVNFVQCQHS